MLASVLTLTAITCERFFAVVKPLVVMRFVTIRANVMCSALIWTISLTISVPSFVYRQYVRREWADFVEESCDDSGWPVRVVKCGHIEQPHKRLYNTSVILLLFFAPVLVMAVTYSIMIVKIKAGNIVDEMLSLQRRKLSQNSIVKRRKKVNTIYSNYKV